MTIMGEKSIAIAPNLATGIIRLTGFITGSVTVKTRPATVAIGPSGLSGNQLKMTRAKIANK